MFIDEIIIKVEAGKGGDGCTSFRHEKFVEKGGPDGGNGGKGGDIIFVGEKGLKTLIDLKYSKIIKADKGKNGSGAVKTGRDGIDTIVKVPLGTSVVDMSTNLMIADIIEDGQKVTVAKGGKGGRGNASFKSNKFKAPTTSEYGLPGEEKTLKCELKLLADIGLIGFPSVGKSSLISVVSKSKPKIADYPFTTLTPNLGVVKVNDTSFVMADLPGIIEGASKGTGLGDKFLKHALRTKMICYVLDMSGITTNPIIDFKILQNEVKSYSEKLYNKKYIVIANKMDIPSSLENLEKFKKEYNIEVIPISTITKEGIDTLLNKIVTVLNETEDDSIYDKEEFEDYVLYEFKNNLPYIIKRVNENTFVITGEKLETLLKKTKFNSDDASLRFARKLKSMKVDEELKKMGAKDNDTIKILDHEFTYKEEE